MSSGSSRRAVPAPTITASAAACIAWTRRRLSSPEIQRASPPAAATLPPRLTAALQVTNGSPVVTAFMKGAFCARARLPASGAGVDHDPARPQASEATPVDERVRVADGDDGACDAGRDEGVGARRRSSFVGAGLEGAVERRVAGGLAGLPQDDALRVCFAGAGVPAGPDDDAVPHEHGADQGIRMGAPAALLGERAGFVHEPIVVAAVSLPSGTFSSPALPARTSTTFAPSWSATERAPTAGRGARRAYARLLAPW